MAATVTRVFDLLQYNLEKFPKQEFISGKVNGKWQKYSTQEFSDTVDALSRGLIELGIGKASRVAVMSANRPEWNITDFAVMQIGAYHIPLYPTLAEHDVKFILENAEITVIFVADEPLYNKLKPVCEELKKDIQIYTFDEVKGAGNWQTLVKTGQQKTETDLEAYRSQITPEDILTLIYTSGTTGTPKGVMLTHNNLVKNFENSAVLLPDGIRKGLSFLPLSHIFERMVVYLYMYCDTAVYYAESMDTIVADIQFVKPNVFSTVPRLLEKVYEKIMEKGKALTGIKRGIFFWSVALAEKFEIENSWFYNLKLGIARKLVFKKWQEALGGEIVVIISGGAALNPRLARIFWAAGMPVFEGYGLTETSPVITVNHFGNTMFGTVGPPINGVEVKIAEDGEVLARGHDIMKGYYLRDDLTAETIDKDGWFHTGDIGELVNGRFLKITDRKKEIFKTAGGKYVAPQMIENKFKETVLVEQVMVLGENRKFPAALIVPNFVALKSWAAKKGINYTTDEEMAKNPQVIEKFNQIVLNSGKDFGKWEQVKRFELLAKPWSIDGGELTPKLSLKRKVILEKYATIIEKIYTDAENYKA
ncbi:MULTISPECIES: AMP-dependent synthetase/ligase [Pedobacter]|uniref:AMP-dependent synthetase and ligase n=1 Tax=Pedobacter heparinus (strain ATCC 13125 / DSM 2366 / CIP 104194 / JCM 7457 / NBRC 12017 / NCIMB 9290 / NRRL B-14731 / HIM 762-3) TaxID=485917 RepID=C6XUD0_PEDHD|nr:MULTISPECIES: long-chain fatty acid--CoA ligase [Pedobacter]ACU05923.1 AMP-dependent synthetase and ligase [Pedobacter heparinus DSM 2366]MBB5438702.1 long-chain acyl-CoA synthetase [Pedobacter sp. AK017]